MLLWQRRSVKSNGYRNNAEVCRVQAEKAVNEAEKGYWLKLEEHWLKLAQEDDRRGS